MPKVEPYSESQKNRKRQLMIGDNEPNSRESRRRLSLTDVPMIVRSRAGAHLSQIQVRPNQQISHAMQQLRDATRVDETFQILLGKINGYRRESPTVERQGNGTFQMGQDFVDEDDRVSTRRQWYDF